MTATDILNKAAGHLKDRAATYDKPQGERSMAAAVRAFLAVTGDGLMNTPERGWLFMALLKAVRSQQGDFKADNYEDGAAYFALAGEAAAVDRAPMAALCTKLKAQRGWPYLPDASDTLEAEAALMREREQC